MSSNTQIFDTNEIKVEDVDPETQAELEKYFVHFTNGYSRCGPGGNILPNSFVKHIAPMRNILVRPDDLWVVTYPRSGTTWISELSWLINNNLDYETASQMMLSQRFTFLEMKALLPENFEDVMPLGEDLVLADYKSLETTLSPRHVKTHLPLSLLPTSLLTGKVIYVARNPKDVAVSFYYHNKLFKLYNFAGDFRNYWELFVKDLITYCPYFAHLKEAWELRDHPNMLFIFYEDMKKDVKGCIRRISQFLGKHYSEEQYKQLEQHVSFDKMKNNNSINIAYGHPDIVNTDAPKFFRNGKVGGWRDHFDEEMTEQVEAWIQKNLQDTDMRLPAH